MSRIFVFFSILITAFLTKNGVVEDKNPVLSFHYRQLDNRNGLSNSSINSILQDNDQLLWIVAWDGLNRYDESRFTVYNRNIDQANNCIGSNVIQSIREDKKNNIYRASC